MRDVGIVMPVYKQYPNYLELALRSVLQQTYGNYYLVNVSDGAPYDTVEVIQKVTKGMKEYISKKKIRDSQRH
ncbi:glycosyltransferase family 2 protein [Peribacillus frigoritolerans]|uniref:glycosyltransferase family 2 protein n=1 Tax=Peribacillus frigoritolerans TaxID=450367 RepID=UPI0023DB739A|nr:glycosyltransferase [Peribacillus frigoritolerans]MDF1997288.1 glycosyltransferase [Peribacillus frigoritolerans]